VTAEAKVEALLAPQQAEAAAVLFDADEWAGIVLHAAAVAALLEAVPERPAVIDRIEQLHKLTGALEVAETARKALDAIRDAHVRPLNTEVQDVNRVFKTLFTLIDARRDVVRLMAEAWQRKEKAALQAEQERLRRIEEEALAKEAEARARAEAAQRPELKAAAESEAAQHMRTQLDAELARPREAPRVLKSAGGGSTALQQKYDLIAIHDLDKVPQDYWRRDVVIEALEKAIRAAVRSGVRAIPGCDIGPVTKLAVRGA
jgi:Rad3-related DNA helicase